MVSVDLSHKTQIEIRNLALIIYSISLPKLLSFYFYCFIRIIIDGFSFN